MSYGRIEDSRFSYRSQPKDFNSLIQTCTANIQKISQHTAQINTMVQQVGTQRDTSELQDRLQQLQHYTNQLAKETNKHLKDLGSLPLSHLDQRQQKIQKERLMNEFSTALNNFQAVQRKAAEKERESVARARAGSRLSSCTDDEHNEEQLVSFESSEDWNRTQAQTQDVAITEEDLTLIKERETAIRQLEANILDVNQIFKDLAMMIHDQGDMIDSIEANVESAEVHVEQGSHHLQRASYYQKKSRKKLCILIAILGVAGVILGLIIWWAAK